MLEPTYILEWRNKEDAVITKSYHMDLEEVQDRLETNNTLIYYKYLKPKIVKNKNLPK